MNKLNPSVDAIVRPIIHDMTQIKVAQATNPLISKNNEPENVKQYKKKCVHMIFDGKEYQIDVSRNTKGDLICNACGHKINTTFGKEEIENLNKSIEILDQMVLFGLVKGLRAEPLQLLIQLKSSLPSAVTLMNELSTFINEEDKANSTMINIGSEYANPGNFGRITSL